MRGSIRHFVKICVETLPIYEPIYEFGSLQVPGQQSVFDLRSLFRNAKYVGCDMREGPGVDCILNLHHINLPAESVGTILLLDTLEHVEFPRKAIDEVYRILKPNGILIMSSVMNFPIHDFPYDYWRFTPDAFRSLLKPFNSSFIAYSGKADFPHTVVGIGFKGLISENAFEELSRRLELWKKQYRNDPLGTGLKIGSGWKQVVRQFIPPIIYTIKRNIRGVPL